MNYKQLAKRFILSFPAFQEKYKNKLISIKHIERYEDQVSNLEEAEKVLFEEPLGKDIGLIGLVKDAVFEYDDTYISPRSYYPKYERFLNNNGLQYEYYDIYSSDWLERASNFDYIIWHTASDPVTQEIAQNKIYILDKILGKKCLPSFDEIWSYENKINAHYLFKSKDLPEIPTYVSHSKSDTVAYLNSIKFPIISKLSTGSASFGVEKLDSKEEALKLVNSIFSFKGRGTYFPSIRQKDYVYFQSFVEDATFDLRIITVDNKAFGYYRFPNKGDFRASGAGNYEKTEIPAEALDLAFKVRACFGSTCLATDLLYSKKYNKYFIIESSIFIGIDTCSQLEINGEAGYYERLGEGLYEFRRGKYWIQELTLLEFFKK